MILVLDVCKWLCSVCFFKQKTAYEMRISDWSSDVCSSDLLPKQMLVNLIARHQIVARQRRQQPRQHGACHGGIQQPHHTQQIRRNQAVRSEERRVGKECVSMYRSRWSQYH